MSDLTSADSAAAAAPPSALWDAFRGAVVGMFEVTVCGQPMVYFKNMLQQGRTPSLNPMVIYRGFGIHASSMVPITAIQMTANNVITKGLLLTTPGLSVPSASQQSLAAVGAGAVTALVASPSELIILYQQNTGISLRKAAAEVGQKYGLFGYFRGMSMVATRDGIFTYGYMNAGPKVQKYVQDSTGSAALGAAASVGVGAVVSVVTHPIDSIKTEIMRPEKPKDYGLRAATRDVAAHGGVGAFFKGALPRTVRVGLSVLIYSNMNMWLDKYRPGLPKPAPVKDLR